MKCPDCRSDLNHKEAVRLAWRGHFTATVCMYCGNLALLCADESTARHLDACAGCGSPATGSGPENTSHCGRCAEVAQDPQASLEPGEQTAARIVRESERLFPSVRVPSQIGYFEQVLAPLAGLTGSAKGDYQTRIASELGFRVLSVPGGAILLGAELLYGLEDEAMLAFVLARELAHQQSGRVLRRFRALRPQRVFTVGFEWGISLITGGPSALDSRSAESVREVVSLGYGPAHEESADAFAVGLLVRSGYDPAASIRVLALLEACDLSSRRALAPFLDVRPVHSRRRVMAEALVTAYAGEGVSVRTNRDAYRRAITRLSRDGPLATTGAWGTERRTHG